MNIKIGYFADGPWAYHAFNKLKKDKSIEVKFICVRYKSRDTVLKRIAEENDIPLLCHKNINSDEFKDLIKIYNVDLFVSMSFDQIFKNEMINLPSLKTINCHAGKLPFYRGRNILNWALINDEKEFGITAHYMDEGIDTGDIILQKTYPITDEDDYRTLLERAYKECGEVLYEAIKDIQKGTQKRIKQSEIHPVGMYCGGRKAGDEKLDWNQTSRDIFNFVRAICEPGPCARTMLNGKEMKINKTELIENACVYKNTVGQIIEKKDNCFLVKTNDTMIKVLEYEYEGKIKVGDRFER